MNLCVDIGNTFSKVGLFDSGQLNEKQIFSSDTDLGEWLKGRPATHAIICSVKGNEESVTKLIVSKEAPIVFSSSLHLPIANHYETPATLGKDRLAAALGANSLFPNTNCLVIDAGTCVTYDFVSQNREYKGGAISPGLQMRFKALNHYTAKLPLIEKVSNADLIGRDTMSSILSGVVNGLKFEIEKTMEEYQKIYPNLKVILCGGDAQFFESIIKGGIFAFPDLVLFGLNHTLLYNAPN